MKSMFTRIKPGRSPEAKQQEAEPLRQKQLLDLKAHLASGSPLHNESGFAVAVAGLRDLTTNRSSQQLEKIRQELIAVAGEQITSFVAAVSAHITDLLVTDFVLIEAPAIVSILTAPVAKGGLEGVFPILSFLVHGNSEAETNHQACVPLVPVLTKMLSLPLEENTKVAVTIEEITDFVSDLAGFRRTAELMQLEWKSFFPQESLSCADFLLASLGNSSFRPYHQLHCLQILQALVEGVASRRRQESRENRPVVDGGLLLSTFQSKHVVLRVVGLALNAYDSYSSNPALLRTLLWRLFGLVSRLIIADQYPPFHGMGDEFEQAGGYQLLGSVILRIGELDNTTDSKKEGGSMISRDEAISKLLQLTQGLTFVKRTVEATESSEYIVRNPPAFGILQRVFVDTQSSWLGLEVLNCLQFIISMHAANRQFVNEAQTLPIFLAMYPGLCLERQQVVLKLLEAMFQGGVVPTKCLQALKSIFLESLNQTTPQSSGPDGDEDEVLNLERMRRNRRRKARMDTGGVKCILRFVTNLVRNEIGADGEILNFARLLRRAGFVGAVFAQISSYVHSVIPSFVPPKGLPSLSSALSEHVSLLSDLESYSAAILVLTLLMPKADHLWTEIGFPVIAPTLQTPFAQASLPLLWHFYRAGSAHGLLFALDNITSLALRSEILSSILQQLVSEHSKGPNLTVRFSTTWIEQGGLKTVLGVLGRAADSDWNIVSTCIRIFGMQLILAPESLVKADFLYLSRQIAASGITASGYDRLAVRVLMDLALGMISLSQYDPTQQELMAASLPLILHRPRVIWSVLHLLPHVAEPLRLQVMNLLTLLSSTKSTLKCYRNCEALASIAAIGELLEVMGNSVHGALLQFCKSDGKESPGTTFGDVASTFIVDVASHRISPFELNKLKLMAGIYAPVLFLHIQRSHYSYLNRGINEQSTSTIEFELHSARSAAVSLPPIPEFAWPETNLSVSMWVNIRQYGREKSEDAGLSPEAVIELADFFIGDSPEEHPDPIYKVTIVNKRLCIRVRSENCIFDKCAIQPEKWHFVTFCHRRGRMLKSAELIVTINGDAMEPVKCPWPHVVELDGLESTPSPSWFRTSRVSTSGPKDRKSTFSSMLAKDNRPTSHVQVVLGNHALPATAGFGSVWWLGTVIVYRGIFEPSFISAMYARGAGFQSSLHPRRALVGTGDESETTATLGSRKFVTTQTLMHAERETGLDPGKIIVAFHPRHRRADMEGVRFFGGATTILSVPISDACRAINGVGLALPLLAIEERHESDFRSSHRLYSTLLFLQALLFRNPKNLREMSLNIPHYCLIAHFMKHQIAPETFDPRIPALLCAIACGAAARPLELNNLGTKGLLARMLTDQDNHGFLNQFVVQYFLFDWGLWKGTSLETQHSLLESLLWLVEEGPTLEKWRKQVVDSLFRNMTFYAPGFNWNFCFACPAPGRKSQLPPDTSMWRAERMRQLEIIPFVLEIITSLASAEAIASLMPLIRSVVLAVVRSFIGTNDLKALFSFFARGCLPNGFLLCDGERAEETKPLVDFVVAFLDALSKTLSEPSKREWVEDVVQRFDFRFLTCLMFPGVEPEVSIYAFQLLNVMLSIESKEEGNNSRKTVIQKRSFAARFEATDGLKSLRFLAPITATGQQNCWMMYSMIFSHFLPRVEPPQPLFEVFKDQFLFTQGNRSWHANFSVKDVLALLDLMSGSNTLLPKTSHKLSDPILIFTLLTLFRDRAFLAANRLKQWDENVVDLTDLLLNFPLRSNTIAFPTTPAESPDATAVLFMLFLFSNHTEFRRSFMSNISSHMLSLVLCVKLGEIQFSQVDDLVQDNKQRLLQTCALAAWTTIIGLTREVVLHGNTPRFHVRAESKKQFTLFSRKNNPSDNSNTSEESYMAPHFMCDKFIDALFECVGPSKDLQFQSRILTAVLESCEFLLKRDFSTGVEEVFHFAAFAKKLFSRPECTPVFLLDWSCGEALADFMFLSLRQVDRLIGISELAGEKFASDRSFLILIRKDLHQSLARCVACLLIKGSSDQCHIHASRLRTLLKKLLQPGNFSLLLSFDSPQTELQNKLLTEMCLHILFWVRRGWWMLREESRKQFKDRQIGANTLPLKPRKRYKQPIEPPELPTGQMFPDLLSIEAIQKEVPTKPPKPAWHEPTPRARTGGNGARAAPPPPPPSQFLDEAIIDLCCELWRALVQSLGAILCPILSRDPGASPGFDKDVLLRSKSGVALLVKDTDDVAELLKQGVRFWTLTPCSFESQQKGITTPADYFAYLSHLMFTLDVQNVRTCIGAQVRPSITTAPPLATNHVFVARSNFLEKIRQSYVRSVEQQAHKNLVQKGDMQKKWQRVELEWCTEQDSKYKTLIQAQWKCAELSEGPLRQMSKIRPYPELYEQYGIDLKAIQALELSAQLEAPISERSVDVKAAEIEIVVENAPHTPPAVTESDMPSLVSPTECEFDELVVSDTLTLDAPWLLITIEEAIRRHSTKSSLLKLPPPPPPENPSVDLGLEPRVARRSVPPPPPERIATPDLLPDISPTKLERKDTLSEPTSTEQKASATAVSPVVEPMLLIRSESPMNVHIPAIIQLDMSVGIEDEDRVSDDSGDELEAEEGPAWRKLRCLLDESDNITMRDVVNCERIDGLETRRAIFVGGSRCVYVIDDFALNDTLEELPPPQQRFGFEVGASYGRLGNAVDRSTGKEWVPATPPSNGIILNVKRPQESSKPPVMPRTVRGCNHGNLRDVCRRHYLFQDLALEIFDRDDRSVFILLSSTKEREGIFQRLNSIIERNSDREAQWDIQTRLGRTLGFRGAFPNATQRWMSGQLSNFGYLMYLNTLAGRSFNDLTQYPVMPWVLADYSSSSLDLRNPAIFRDLAKPMGALDPTRAVEFQARYEDWPEEFPPPFHYGSHYSSSGIVIFYLVRLMPFTNMALQHQGGYFDKADRLFHDVQSVWENASGLTHQPRPSNEKGNLQDVRELIPEWYTLPGMFKNSNRFHLGRTQDGTSVHDVHLPPWAKSDPVAFVRILRAALESDYVSAHLHEWIDLIFGHAQRGKAALDAQNVFYYMTYSGAVDVDTLKDPTIRAATISQIHNFGQTPQQLFKKPHPKRFGTEPIENFQEPEPSSQLKIMDRPHWLQSSHPPSLANQPPFKQAIAGLAWDGVRLTVVEGKKALIPPKFGHFIAWGFADYGLRLFSAKDREGVLQTYEFLHDAQISKAVASDMGHLITGGYDTIVNIYSLSPTGLTQKASLCAHTGAISAICVSTAFHFFVTGGDDCMVILWDLITFRFIRRLLPHPGPVSVIAIDDLLGDIATASGDWIFLWDMNGDLLTVMNTHWQSFSFSSMSSFWLENDSIDKPIDDASDSDDEADANNLAFNPSDERDVTKRVHSPPALPSRVSPAQTITALTFGQASDSTWFLVSGHGDGNVSLWTLELSALANRRGAPPLWPVTLPACMASSYAVSDRVCCRPHIHLPVDRDLNPGNTVPMPLQPAERKTRNCPTEPCDSASSTLPSTMYLHLLSSYPSSTSDHKSAITCLHCPPDVHRLWSGDSHGVVNEWHVKQKLTQTQASNCRKCDTHFTYTTRRHHCRKCRLTVCQKCSSHRTTLPELGYQHPVRVCSECYSQT